MLWGMLEWVARYTFPRDGHRIQALPNCDRAICPDNQGVKGRLATRPSHAVDHPQTHHQNRGHAPTLTVPCHQNAGSVAPTPSTHPGHGRTCWPPTTTLPQQKLHRSNTPAPAMFPQGHATWVTLKGTAPALFQGTCLRSTTPF